MMRRKGPRPGCHSAIVSDAEQAAQQAQALLDQPALQRDFAAAEAVYLARIRQSDPVSGVAERETAFMLLHALDALRADRAATATGDAIARRSFRSSLQPTETRMRRAA